MAERSIRYKIDVSTEGLQRGLSQAQMATQQATTRMGRSLRQNQQQFTAVGAAAVGAGAVIGAGLVKATATAAEFESRMNSVRAVSGATGQQFEQLQSSAREMGATTRFSATESADALQFLSMAGFQAQESVEALPGVLDLAAAGNMELGRSADIASNVLQGFGLEADEIGRVVDSMAETFTSSNTSLEQLGRSMSFVAPVANSAGLELEETAAAIGLMGDSGIQGSRAGTALRQSISRLLNPVGQAQEVINDLGLSVSTSDGQLRSLTTILGQLEEAGATTADVVSLFGQEAGPAMAALLERGTESLEDFTGQLETSGGAAAEVAQTQMEGLKGATIELGSALEALQIRIGETGLAGFSEEAVDSLTGLVRMIEDLPGPVLTAGTAMAGLASTAGVLGGGFLILAPRVLELTDRFGGARAAAGSMGRTFRSTARFMVGPWGAAIGSAAGVLGTMIDQQQKTADETRALRNEFEDQAVAAEELSNAYLVTRLREQGVLSTVDDLGLSLNTVRQAALGHADAMTEVDMATGGASGAFADVRAVLSGLGLPVAEDDAIALRNAIGAVREGTQEYNESLRAEGVLLGQAYNEMRRLFDLSAAGPFGEGGGAADQDPLGLSRWSLSLDGAAGSTRETGNAAEQAGLQIDGMGQSTEDAATALDKLAPASAESFIPADIYVAQLLGKETP